MGYDAPEVLFCIGLVLARLEEEGGESLVDTNDVVVGDLTRDWKKGISGLHQMEDDLSAQHGTAFPAATAWAAMATMVALAKKRPHGRRSVAAAAWAMVFRRWMWHGRCGL